MAQIKNGKLLTIGDANPALTQPLAADESEHANKVNVRNAEKQDDADKKEGNGNA